MLYLNLGYIFACFFFNQVYAVAFLMCEPLWLRQALTRMTKFAQTFLCASYRV